MSTRNQLRFVQRVEQTGETDGNGDRVAQVYRQSDGCPESILRDLTELKELLDATRAERGPSYTVATFAFLDKLSTVGLFLLGHGVEDPTDSIYGDEEYLYVVAVSMEFPFDEPAEWTVKVGDLRVPPLGRSDRQGLRAGEWQSRAARHCTSRYQCQMPESST